MRWICTWLAAGWLLWAGAVGAGADVDNWPATPIIRHADFQAVNADGTPAYGGGFPIRLIGVVLNNSDDWLDPTAAYDSGVHYWALGGEAEIFVQALTESTLEALGVEYYDPTDFGGAACWIGQNYGNHIMHGDPLWSYTDPEWTAELARLNLAGGDGVSAPIAAGDLVEIRARAGMHYLGKMNVNEQHDNDYDRAVDGLNHDFEIIRLAPGFGLPAPTDLTLADLKTPDDAAVFDPTRQTGGEHHQATRVRLMDVSIAEPVAWTADTDITVTDGARTLAVHLGRDDRFDGTERFAVGEPFHIVGVLDQAADDGTFSTDGYRLLVMSVDDLAPAGGEPLAGDADNSGAVDIDDFVILKNNFGAAPDASWGQGDFNGDGVVDIDDFVILKNNFGTSR